MDKLTFSNNSAVINTEGGKLNIISGNITISGNVSLISGKSAVLKHEEAKNDTFFSKLVVSDGSAVTFSDLEESINMPVVLEGESTLNLPDNATFSERGMILSSKAATINGGTINGGPLADHIITLDEPSQADLQVFGDTAEVDIITG